MTNETVTFNGKVRWASVPPNAPRKPFEINPDSPEDSSYSIEVECSKTQFEELKAKGIPRLTELRTDDNGETYIRLRATKIRGKYTFPDPAVVDSNGNPLGKKIANGSEALVKAEIAPIKGRKGVALRLKAVMVTKLIEFASTNAVNDLLKEVNPHAEEEAHNQDLNPSEDW